LLFLLDGCSLFFSSFCTGAFAAAFPGCLCDFSSTLPSIGSAGALSR